MSSRFAQLKEALKRKEANQARREQAERAEQVRRMQEDFRRRETAQLEKNLRSKEFSSKAQSFLERSGIVSPGNSPMMMRKGDSSRSASTLSRRPPALPAESPREDRADDEGFESPGPVRGGVGESPV